ncbi:cupredoxin domain-containing protein [Halomicrococcus gelatinilyticus]|uniref:cupredoxin domain-containing protein n=1 Tax=Halomicrococcus gelatinilyticus TaxID=1702103 RepID=UPI002E0DD2B0
MTASTGDPTDESTDESTSGLPGVERRPLLKALGVGATLSLGSGLATASAGEDEMHPQYGYATPDAADLPAGLEADHEVELHTEIPNEESADHAPFYAHFEPSGLHVSAGDVVQFTFRSPDHTVTPYHPGHGYQRRVPKNVPPFSSPIVNVGGAWLYRFEEPGLYDLFCAPHHVFGMTARVVVDDMVDGEVPDYESTFEGSEDPLLFAPWSKQVMNHELNAFSAKNENAEWPYMTPQAVLDADALDPEAIQIAGTVSFDAVRDELGYPSPER